MDFYLWVCLSYTQRQDILQKLKKYSKPESFITYVMKDREQPSIAAVILSLKSKIFSLEILPLLPFEQAQKSFLPSSLSLFSFFFLGKKKKKEKERNKERKKGKKKKKKLFWFLSQPIFNKYFSLHPQLRFICMKHLFTRLDGTIVGFLFFFPYAQTYLLLHLFPFDIRLVRLH